MTKRTVKNATKLDVYIERPGNARFLIIGTFCIAAAYAWWCFA